MEDANQIEERSVIQTSRRVFILFAGFPYILILILLYISYISSVEKNFVAATIEFVFIGVPVVFGTLTGLVLISIAAFAYITRMSNPSCIPQNSSIYESITRPTIQYGPLKLIMPVMEEEIVEEVQIVEIDE
ncbi:MAG: hypothetical protein ACW964_20235 [Candidatus Hodarchaeales archaeon]|jgi:uncharacterized integral membrane protein